MTRTICLFCIALLLVTCRMKEVEYTGVKGFKVNTINTSGINGDIFLGIKNPNNFGFSIFKSSFDVTFSGIYLGKAKLTKRVHIGANAEETYGFNLASDFKNVKLNDILKLLQGATSRGELDVKGNLRVGKVFVWKKLPVDLHEKIRLE